jgi:hypothetical protein
MLQTNAIRWRRQLFLHRDWRFVLLHYWKSRECRSIIFRRLCLGRGAERSPCGVRDFGGRVYSNCRIMRFSPASVVGGLRGCKVGGAGNTRCASPRGMSGRRTDALSQDWIGKCDDDCPGSRQQNRQFGRNTSFFDCGHSRRRVGSGNAVCDRHMGR